jgi:hypothetical protein
MSRGIQAFRQTDVTKAIRGAQNAGLEVQRFEIDRAGTIVVMAKASPGAGADPEKVSA